MSQIQIPKGWTMENLSEHIEDFEKRNPKNLPDEEFKYVEIGSVGPDKKIHDFRKLLGTNAPSRARNVIRKNDVIYGTTRPYYRNVVLIPKDFDNEICSTGFCVLRIKNSKLNPRFLFYYMLSDNANNQILKPMRGGSYPAVSNKDITSINIFIPPIPIQIKIAQKLDFILEQLEEKKKLVFNLQKRNISLFEKLTKQKRGRERQIGFMDYLADALVEKIVSKCESNFPNHILSELEFLCKDILDTPHSTVKYFEAGIPVIRTSDIIPYTIDFSNTKYTSQEIYLERKKKLDPQKGDILYTREAPWGLAAEVSREKFVVGQRILLLRPDREKIQSDFFTLILNSSFGYNQAKKIVKKTTSEHVNIGDIKKFLIPLIPKTEQEKIISIISKKLPSFDSVVKKLSQLVSQQNKMLEYFENLYPTILNSAFTGKLIN